MQLDADMKWTWKAKGDPMNHWVVPTRANVLDTDPVEVPDAFAYSCSLR
jgi:hypothetical protein